MLRPKCVVRTQQNFIFTCNALWNHIDNPRLNVENLVTSWATTSLSGIFLIQGCNLLFTRYINASETEVTFTLLQLTPELQIKFMCQNVLFPDQLHYLIISKLHRA